MKTIDTTITGHKVVSREEWIAARKELLALDFDQIRQQQRTKHDRSIPVYYAATVVAAC